MSSAIPVIIADLPAILAAIQKLASAYQTMRAVAAQAGATPQQLIEADARFAKYRPDPLGSTPPPPPPPPTPSADPTTTRYPTYALAAAARDALAGSVPSYPNVVRYAANEFGVWPNLTPMPGSEVVTGP